MPGVLFFFCQPQGKPWTNGKSVPDYRWFCDSGVAYALRITES